MVYSIYEVGATLNHALVDELLERLFLARDTEVEEELIPEAAVNQVARGVLRTSDVEVDVLPILVHFLVNECLLVARVHIAKVVG